MPAGNVVGSSAGSMRSGLSHQIALRAAESAETEIEIEEDDIELVC